MEMLNYADQKELFATVKALGIKPHIIAETGSKAWGTDIATSDHDLTVIADDVNYDVYSYPRTAFTAKIQFKGQDVDVRMYSIERFLRKVLKTNLSAYEVVHTQWHMGPEYLHKLLADSLDYFYDPREMFRSCRGNIAEIRDKGWKGRRQMFRYSFMCLQLIDGITTGNKPVMSVQNYLDKHDGAMFNNKNLVSKLHAWAMSEYTTEKQDAEWELVMRGIRSYDFPASVDFKQGAERDYMNSVFAKFRAHVDAKQG